MLTVLGGLAEFERELDPRPHWRRPRPRQGARAKLGATVQADAAPAAGSHQAARRGRGDAYRNRAQLQCQRADDFTAYLQQPTNIGITMRFQHKVFATQFPIAKRIHLPPHLLSSTVDGLSRTSTARRVLDTDH